MARFTKSNIKSGMFAGHIKKGKKQYIPPIVYSGVFKELDWQRTDLPDLLWPILVAHLKGDGAIRGFVNWQKELIGTLGLRGHAQGSVEYLDGRLSGLELLAKESIERQDTIRNAASRHGLLPGELRRLLLIYPSFPGRWILENKETMAPEDTDLSNLHDAVVGVLSNGHREALIKCISIWAAVQGGTFSADKLFIESLVDYPINMDNRDRADALVRASWPPRQKFIEQNLPEREALTKEWSQEFWGINSQGLPCFRRQDSIPFSSTDLDNSKTSEEKIMGKAHTKDSQPSTTRYQIVQELIEDFIESLELSGFEQQARQKYEVNSGLLIRAGRELLAVLESPVLWTSEYGSHITRMLVETQIYLTWMSKQKDEIYRKYQEYGFGKAKLHALMLEETPEELLTDEIRESIKEFKRLSRNSDVLDFRTIDARDSFAEGKSIRKMADESELMDLYTRVYGVSSGVTHSEWWSIEQNAMEECQNVLHGGHLIPSLSLNSGGDTRLPDCWINMYTSMMEEVVGILELEWQPSTPTGASDSSTSDSGSSKASPSN